MRWHSCSCKGWLVRVFVPWPSFNGVPLRSLNGRIKASSVTPRPTAFAADAVLRQVLGEPFGQA